MVVSVASYVIVGWVEGGRLEVFPPIKCLYFHTTSSMTEFSAFSETDFLYTALHYTANYDRPSLHAVKYLHGICLCKYHNSRSH